MFSLRINICEPLGPTIKKITINALNKYKHIKEIDTHKLEMVEKQKEKHIKFDI